MNFNDDLRAWLKKKQTSEVFAEFLPDTPQELVAFFVFSSVPETLGVQRYVQVQVVRKDLMSAYKDAYALALALDSGVDEDLISLTSDRHVIARPTARPRSMGYDNQKRAKYYFEVALIGQDKE